MILQMWFQVGYILLVLAVTSRRVNRRSFLLLQEFLTVGLFCGWREGPVTEEI